MASLTWLDNIDRWTAFAGDRPFSEAYAEVKRYEYRNRILWVFSDGNTVQMDRTDVYFDLDEAKAAVEARYAAETTPHIVEATVQAKSVLVVMSDGRRWRVLLSELEVQPTSREQATVTAWLQGVEL